MKKTLSLTTLVLLTGCISTPESVNFKGETVGTYSVAASCKTMMLDTDCSGFTGATKDISIDNVLLRVASGDNGKVIFIMPESSLSTNEPALKKGSGAIEQLLTSKGISIVSKKVMFGGGEVYGVHFTLDRDGYSLLHSLSI
jgi:hypothetical protein